MALLTLAETMPRSQLRLLAPAKLNITLAVGPRRGDGFHDLDSLVVGVDLCDRLSIQAVTGKGVDVRVRGAEIAPNANLVGRAVEAFRATAEIEVADVQFDLEKRIPVGAGMGGGSSDAAAALMLLNEWFGHPLDPAALRGAGATIGSDVPVFFDLPVARMTGRGDVATPLPVEWDGWALIVSADVEVPTAAVYQRFDGLGKWSELPRCGDAALGDLHAEGWNEVAFNDLRGAVFDVAPPVGELASRLGSLGLGQFALTGAGSTFFRFYDDEEAARGDMRQILSRVGDVHATVARCPVGVSTDYSEDD